MRPFSKLTLDEAQAILAAARKKADEIGAPMCIAIVDEGGTLIAFARMDRARYLSAGIAVNKAMASANTGNPTGPLATSQGPDTHISLALTLASDLHFTSLPGGLPLRAGTDIVGGLGVSGGTGEQDVQVAQAGVAAFAGQ